MLDERVEDKLVLDRKVTLAVLFAVLVQAGGGLMWAGAAGERLSEIEARVSAQDGVSERLARVEAQLHATSQQLQRIEDKLDRR
ncbi:hypothetical protein GC169_04835 [bacterium]|nr:hypothetical protein [bacterium]